MRSTIDGRSTAHLREEARAVSRQCSVWHDDAKHLERGPTAIRGSRIGAQPADRTVWDMTVQREAERCEVPSMGARQRCAGEAMQRGAKWRSLDYLWPQMGAIEAVLQWKHTLLQHVPGTLGQAT